MVFTNRHYENIISEKLFNELHDWIDKHHHLIQYPNVSFLLSFKINGNLVNKQKQIIKISVWELHNDMILTITQGYCFGAKIVDGKLCIGDTSHRKYTPKNI